MARRRRRSRNRKNPLIYVLAALVLMVIGFNLYGNIFVRGAIERHASAVLQVPVKISSLNFSLISGDVTLSGLEVGNPSGFSSPHSIEAKDIEARIDMASLLRPVVEIQSLRITGLKMFYEITPAGNNIRALQKNAASTAQSPANPAQARAENSRKAVIRDFYVTESSVSPSIDLVLQKKSAVVALPDIHLRNLGEGRALTIAEASDLVLSTLAKNAGGKMPSNLLEQGLGNVGKGIKEMGQGIWGGVSN